MGETEGVGRHEIEARLGQRGSVIWLTGLSGAGKSTIAHRLQAEIFERGNLAVVLDGDLLRRGLCNDLGFSPEDRAENVRRAAHVASLFADSGILVIVALISPYRVDRERARRVAEPRFFEVFIRASLETCEARDTKGLYKKARAGEIPEFTGVSAPYEPPESPDANIDCETISPAESTAELLSVLERHGIIGPRVA